MFGVIGFIGKYVDVYVFFKVVVGIFGGDVFFLLEDDMGGINGKGGVLYGIFIMLVELGLMLC